MAEVKVLFVCLGNICRSPTAEAIFKGLIEERNLQANFVVDSCGTGGGNPDWYKPGGWSYHEGEPPDVRMHKEAKRRGYTLDTRSRPLTKDDINNFDYIIGMDKNNEAAVLEAATAWGNDYETTTREKYSSICSYCTKHAVSRVPDPYYEGGFTKVFDILHDGCTGLLKNIENQLNKGPE